MRPFTGKCLKIAIKWSPKSCGGRQKGSSFTTYNDIFSFQCPIMAEGMQYHTLLTTQSYNSLCYNNPKHYFIP